ncbi:MAG: chemotaxis protein CheW [Planctomycetota bacterium]
MTNREHEALLRERARALAIPLASDSPSATTVPHLSVMIGCQWFAIATRFVTNVLTDAVVTPLPATPPTVAGITTCYGEVVSVLHLSRLYDLGEPVTAAVIVLGVDHIELALTVAALGEIIDLDPDTLSPGTSDHPLLSHHLIGIHDSHLAVLSGQSILDDPRLYIPNHES